VIPVLRFIVEFQNEIELERPRTVVMSLKFESRRRNVTEDRGKRKAGRPAMDLATCCLVALLTSRLSTRRHHRNDKQTGRLRAGDVICDCTSVACTDAVLCITEASIVCEFPNAVDRMNASIAAHSEIGL